MNETSRCKAIVTNVVPAALGGDIEVGVGQVGIEEPRAENDLNHWLVFNVTRVVLSKRNGSIGADSWVALGVDDSSLSAFRILYAWIHEDIVSKRLVW